MSRRPEPSPDRLPEAALEAYLDGELSAAEAAALERRLEASPALAAELELARRIQRTLRAAPARACPPEVSRRVLEHARRLEGREERWRRLLAVRPAGGRWRPALALGGALAAAVVLAVGLQSALAPAPEAEVSAAEVARAEADVKLALAYLDKISRTTSRTVGEDVLEERVAEPFARSVAGALAQGEKGAEP